MAKVLEVSVEDISPNPYQPRKAFGEESLQELANSIAENGLLQPPVARLVNGKYELVAGERRLRAIKLLGWETMPILLNEASESETAAAAIVENMQREDVNALEEASSIALMIERLGLTQAQVARKLGLSQAKISQKLALLNLVPKLQEEYLEGRMSQSVGRILALLSEDMQGEIVGRVASMTAKDAQAIVNGSKRIERIHPDACLNSKLFRQLWDAGCVDAVQASINLIGLSEEVYPLFSFGVLVDGKSGQLDFNDFPRLLELSHIHLKRLFVGPEGVESKICSNAIRADRIDEVNRFLLELLEEQEILAAQENRQGLMLVLRRVEEEEQKVLGAFGENQLADSELAVELSRFRGAAQDEELVNETMSSEDLAGLLDEGWALLGELVQFRPEASETPQDIGPYLTKRPPSGDNPARKQLLGRASHLAKLAYRTANELGAGERMEALVELSSEANQVATNGLHGGALSAAYRSLMEHRLRVRQIYLGGEAEQVEGSLEQLVHACVPDALVPPISGDEWIVVRSSDAIRVFDPMDFNQLFPTPVYSALLHSELALDEVAVAEETEEEDDEETDVLTINLPQSLIQRLEAQTGFEGAEAVQAYLIRQLQS
ncbi:ParB/RepB/Spo0J family partition protein [Paenibacillus pasadenensis]|uniref:ParB/RepB/Spo0J family partition protein n=1 Tax=Paenibacillus pasadenensis TaxID=217090 RepID=UPI0003FB56C6|nr:ParB/RepB/Spo0J family partition protein [Paenibacillus pasadenensis]